MKKPLAVIPLAKQVKSDSSASTAIVLLLIPLVLLGALAVLAGAGLPGAIGPTVLAVVMVGIGLYLWRALRKPLPESSQLGPPFTPDVRSQPSALTLEYQSHTDYRRERGTLAAGTAGFFFALGVCGGGCALLAATAQALGQVHANVFYLLLVVAAVICACIFGRFIGKRYRGFTPGMIIGMVLGMMALGPFGVLYVMCAIR